MEYLSATALSCFSQRWYYHLKLMNFTMDVDDEKVEATVHTNGLTYTDFDSRSTKLFFFLSVSVQITLKFPFLNLECTCMYILS